jgi:hypothetical protein
VSSAGKHLPGATRSLPRGDPPHALHDPLQVRSAEIGAGWLYRTRLFGQVPGVTQAAIRVNSWRTSAGVR